jgi:hypothetical protein
MVNKKTKVLYVLIASGLVALLFSIYSSLNTASQDSIGTETYKDIIISHPRIFIADHNKAALQKKAQDFLSDAYALLTSRVNHRSIPSRLSGLTAYIYKYGYLYQMTGNEEWADYAIEAMEKFPRSIEAYGGDNNGYAHAMEGLAMGFDWCYERIVAQGKKEYFISLINKYYEGNRKNLDILPDFHNYASQAEFAMLAAGLATYGDNPKAPSYLKEAQNIMEYGETRKGVVYKVKDSIKFVDGTCNWEGVTYGRQQLFSYIKYAEAWRTATNGRVDLWKNDFSMLENAGYYIIYSLRPDDLFETVGDVNYHGLSYFDINNLSALQSRFKNRYFTAFLNKYYRWNKGKFETDIWLGHSRYSLIFYLLWYDPELAEADLNKLPKSRKFGDEVIIRTGFSPDDTFITFKSGIHWGFHSQLDHGSFTIFKQTPLVIDSGYYDDWNRGKKHNWNYWKRTIAHNTLLIDNPDDKLPTWPKNNKFINDGGQRIAFVTFDPPHRWSGSHNMPLSVSDLKERFEEFSMGKITSYEPNDDYVYIRTDLTNAYNNKYSGQGNNQPPKAKAVIREFVYLDKGCVVVFDRVDALNPDFTKKWLLHSGSYYDDKIGKPEMNGSLRTVAGTEEAGGTESSDSNLVTITNAEGKLFVRTLLPERHITRRVGGKGYEFWVGGENQNISTEKIPKERSNEDPGAWRIEIQPEGVQNYDEFLNVLYACESRVPFALKIEKIDAISKDMVGAHIFAEGRNFVALFNRSEYGVINALEYVVKTNSEVKHLLFNMKPNIYYQISQSITQGLHKITVSKTDKNTGILSSSKGILIFKTSPIKQ